MGYIVRTLNAGGDSGLDEYLDRDSVMFACETCTYGSGGRRISSSSHLADSPLRSVRKHHCDSNNRTSKVEEFDAAGKLQETTTNEQDGSGLLVRATTTDASGNRLGYRDYSYSSASYTMTVTSYDCTKGTGKQRGRDDSFAWRSATFERELVHPQLR